MVLPIVIEVKTGPGNCSSNYLLIVDVSTNSTIKSAILVLMDGGGLAWRISTDCDEEELNLYEPPAMRRCHPSDKTRLMEKFVNALESIAMRRAESLTGSRTPKIKNYSIDVEPDSESMQVKIKEEKDEGLCVTLAWLNLLPVESPTEAITILVFYLKSFADRESELTWANRSLKHHNAMLVARTQEEGKGEAQAWKGMDQISRQVTSLLNEKKAKIRSLGAMLYNFEAHGLEGCSSVLCDHEKPKEAKYWKKSNSEERFEEISQGDNSTFVRKVEICLDGEDVQIDQGHKQDQHQPEGAKNTFSPSFEVNSATEMETEKLTDCAAVKTKANTSRHVKQKVTKGPKVENDEDSYFSYGSDSDL